MLDHKLVLIAGQEALDQLSVEGSLGALLVATPAGRLLEELRAPKTAILCCTPASLAIPSSSASQTQLELFEETLAALRGATLCHLVLAGGAGMPDAEERLPRLASWFDELQGSPRRAAALSLVGQALIVVCADNNISNDSRAALQQLLGSGKAARVDACYMMLRELQQTNTGVQLHARHVWALAVAPLLARLCEAGPDLSRSGQVRAWRTITAGVRPDAERLPEDLERAFHDARVRLLSALSQPTGHALPERPGPGIAMQHVAFDIASENWFEHTAEEFAAGDLLQQLSKRSGNAALESGAQRLNRRFTELATASPSLVEEFVTRTWTTLHGSPAVVIGGDTSVLTGARPSAEELHGHLMTHWSHLTALRRERDELIAAGDASARELKRAQQAYIGGGARALVALVVGTFVGYVAMVVIAAVSGSWATGLNAAAVAVVGAFLGASLPMLMERKALLRGQERFIENYLQPIASIEPQKYATCRSLMAAAAVFGRQLKLFAAGNLLAVLVSRLQSLLTRELDRGLRLGAPSVANSERIEEDREGRDRRDAQRGAFLRECHRATRQRPAGDADAAARLLDRVVEERVRSLTTMWRSWCAEHDTAARGYLPPHSLVPVIRRWLSTFRAELVDHVCFGIGEDASAADILEWIDHVRKIHNFGGLGGFSCPITGAAPASLTTLVLLRPGSVHADVHAALERGTLGMMVPAKLLERTPLVGLVIQEVRLQLDARQDTLAVTVA